MKTLIVGATGTIGKEIAKLSEERGDMVVSVSRKGENSMNIDDPESIDAYFEKNSDFDAIICAAGNASFGKLSALNDEEFSVGIRSKLMGQVNLVKKGLSKLNPGGTIILTGGMLAYSPWPETSNIALVNAGLQGFVRAMALEMEDDKRVFIVHPPLVAETADAMGMDANPWPKANSVAKAYVSALIEKPKGESIFVEGYSIN